MTIKNKILVSAAALFVLSVFGISQLTAQAASIDRTRDCDKYAIVYCGTMSVSEIRDKYSEKDHDNVFRAFGISKADVSGDIRKGTVYQDGRVVVGGKTVATNAVMAARYLGGSSISGSSTAKKTSVSRMGSAQEALVKFNADGEFEWAIMTPCGNPVKATPVKVKKPVYSCDGLNAVSLSRTKYEFTTDATAKDGASVASYNYTFGDGHTAKAGKTTTHTYAKPGTYTVSVKVSVTVHGKTLTAPGDCQTTITVAPENCPIKGKENYPKDSPECKDDKPSIEITKTVNDVEHAVVAVDEEFTYKVVVTNTGDIALKDAVVTDKAPSQVTLVSANVGTVSGNTWTYTIPSLAVGESDSFTITAKYAKYAGGTHKNTVCVDTPTVPGSPDDCDDATTKTGEKIEVCDTDTNEVVSIERDEFDATHMTKDVSKCDEEEAPEELPETGVAENIGTVVGAGSLISAAAAYVASRRSI